MAFALRNGLCCLFGAIAMQVKVWGFVYDSVCGWNRSLDEQWYINSYLTFLFETELKKQFHM
jgi:hypothetical protein